MEELKKYLEEHTDILATMVTDVNYYNGGLEDFVYYDNDEYFYNTYFDEPVEVARAIYYGEYNYKDDYIKFNVYGNLETCNKWEYESILADNIEEIFNEWYNLPYSEKNINDAELDELIKKYES